MKNIKEFKENLKALELKFEDGNNYCLQYHLGIEGVGAPSFINTEEELNEALLLDNDFGILCRTIMYWNV